MSKHSLSNLPTQVEIPIRPHPLSDEHRICERIDVQWRIPDQTLIFFGRQAESEIHTQLVQQSFDSKWRERRNGHYFCFHTGS